MADGYTHNQGPQAGQPSLGGQPGGFAQGPQPSASSHAAAGSSPWWASNAAADPWRDPRSSAVVQHTATPMLPPTEPPVAPKPVQGASRGTVVVSTLLCAVLAAFLGTALTLYAVDERTASMPETERPMGEYQEIIDQVMPTVVTVWIEAGEVVGNGSGFVFGSEGHIVTNEHVAGLVEEEDDATVMVQFNDGQMAEAEYLGGATSTDIAVLQVDRTDLSSVSIGESDGLHVGDQVMAVGAPLGLSHTVTEGIVSALDRPVLAGETEADTTVTSAIQTDAAINPGNSGGPLFDVSGQVVGVNTSIYTFANAEEEGGSIGLGFAIPIAQAERVAAKIVDEGVAERTELGVELEPTPFEEPGATLDAVEDGGPADSAGLEAGDVITEFDGEPIMDELQLVALVLKAAPDDEVTVTYERDDEVSDVAVTLAGAPED